MKAIARIRQGVFVAFLFVVGCAGTKTDEAAIDMDARASCAARAAVKGTACGLAGPMVTSSAANWCAVDDAKTLGCFENLGCGAAGSVVLTGRDPCRSESGDRIDLPKGFQPEGFTKGPGNLAYVGTLTRGAVVRVDLVTGLADFVVPPGAKTERAIAGVTYDAGHDAIFACGAWFADGFVFDATTGATRAHIDFPRGPKGTLINAVAVEADAAYFTDSVNPWFYRVPVGVDGLPSGAPVRVPLVGDFVMVPGLEVANSNGIVAIPGIHRLLVLNSANGVIYNVDAATGEAKAVTGVSVPQADGLQLDAQRLVIVQNAPENRVTVVRLDTTMSHGTVTATLTDPRLSSPTNPVIVGDALWIVDSRLADIFHGNAQPNDRFDVVRLRLPAD